jgi:hypothetical protein
VGLTLEAADAVLKDDYHGPVVELLNNGNVLLAVVERDVDAVDFTGRRWVRAIHTKRNRGVGARAEGGTLPTGYNQGYDNTYGPFRSMYARIQLTGQTIAAMARNKGAFIRALEPEMEGAVTDAKRDYCRQLWGTSDGVIATVAAGGPGTTLTLSTAYNKQNVLRWLDDGFLIGVQDVSAADADLHPAGGLGVRSVDYDAGTFVIENPDGTNAANITTGAGDKIVRYAAYGASDNSGNPGDGQIELTGLQTMVDDTLTLHTLAPSTEPRWKSKVWSNSGTLRNITENLVMRAVMNGEVQSGRTVNLLIGSDGVFRAYGSVLTALRRITETVTLKGGYEGLSIGVPRSGRGGASRMALTWDRDCPDNKLFGLDTDSFAFAELQDWMWEDRQGAVLVQVDNQDVFTATLKKYGEFVNTRRNANWVIEDITEQ